MATTSGSGPRLAIVGAARSGTSTLASQLSAHPDIDSGKVKESNYFSRHFDRGAEWYEALYQPARPGLLRLDASTSYTYPQFPQALARLAEAGDEVFVVYVVRHPLERAVSHYLYYRHYFRREPAKSFGEAMRTSSYYTDVSDYAHWIPLLHQTFGKAKVLVVPFEAVATSSHDVAAVICAAVGISVPPLAQERVAVHRNNVVAYRAESVRLAARTLRRSSLYPKVRSAVGAHRLRSVRRVLTRQPTLPDAEQVLMSCDDTQRKELAELESRARTIVQAELAEQDARYGVEWSTVSFASASQ